MGEQVGPDRMSGHHCFREGNLAEVDLIVAVGEAEISVARERPSV